MTDTFRPEHSPYDGAPLTHQQAIDGRMADAYVDARLPEGARQVALWMDGALTAEYKFEIRR